LDGDIYIRPFLLGHRKELGASVRAAGVQALYLLGFESA
jgi:hypothetical protein